MRRALLDCWAILFAPSTGYQRPPLPLHLKRDAHSFALANTRPCHRCLQLDASNAMQEEEIEVSRPNLPDSSVLKIAYRVVRPMSLLSTQAAPIVVIHGGMSLPSNYLYPLANAVPYRSIVFYDQIGCGSSSQPSDKNSYSIDYAVDDLQALITELGLQHFHLYGNSFGGILAFEYMKRVAENGDDKNGSQRILSAVLASTPTSVEMAAMEYDRLLLSIKTKRGVDNPRLIFRKEHECRTEEIPKPLQDAYDKCGSVWFGFDAVDGWAATPPSSTALRMPPTMVLRGEHDFCTDACIENWPSMFNHKFVRRRVLEGCSHHGQLERPHLYGETLDSYFAEYD